jgi:D-mannonate dehydratase
LRLMHEATERMARSLRTAGDTAGAVAMWSELHERLPGDSWVREQLEFARAELASARLTVQAVSMRVASIWAIPA